MAQRDPIEQTRSWLEERLASRDIGAIADYLADKPYLMGDRPCGADATVFPFMAHALCPHFETAILTCAGQRPNLVAYRDRLMEQYFPDFAGAGKQIV
jgi:glutathione S-transferase